MLLFGIAVGLIKHGARSIAFAVWFSIYELTITLRNLTLAGGLVCAIIASLGLLWKQGIRKAILATVYAPLLVTLASVILLVWHQNHQDSSAIERRFSEFCPAISEGGYSTAYSYMSPEYRQTHSPGQFSTDEDPRYDLYSNINAMGCELSPHHHVQISGDNAVLYPNRCAFMEVYGGPAYELVKVNGIWWFTGKSTWYSD